MIEWENKVIAYINGDLSKTETNALMNEVKISKELQNLLAVHQGIESDFENYQEEVPTNKLSSIFYSHLSGLQGKENHNSVTEKVFSIRPFLKYVAACIVLIAASVTLWHQIDFSDKGDINTLLSEMKSKSDTDKIKAIYTNNNYKEDNRSKIMKILIESLKNDKSSNVRLASVETLMEYVDDDLVRSALIRSLGVEKDPQVQIAIIMALSSSKNIEVIKPLEEIINKEDGYKFVKDEAHVGIMNLTSI